MSGEPIEDVGSDAIATHKPGHHDDDGDGQGVEQHNENEVHKGFETALSLAFAFAMHEERHGHGNHWEDARREQRGEAPKNGFENHAPDVGLRSSGGFRLSGLNHSGFAINQVDVLGQRDALAILAGLIGNLARNGETAVFQFTEGLGKSRRPSELFVLRFEDVVVVKCDIGKVTSLTHGLEILRGLDVEHRRQRSQIGHFCGIDVELWVDGSRSNQVELVLVEVLNRDGPFHRVNDLSLRSQRHDGNESHQQADKEFFHIINIYYLIY